MNIFWIWVGGICLVLAIYALILWRRSAKGSRFQARLTILFLLFILVPTIPLTFLVSAFITENTRFMLMPETTETLDQAQGAIRQLALEKNKIFLSAYTDPYAIPEKDLDLHGFSYFVVLQKKKNDWTEDRLWSRSVAADSIRVNRNWTEILVSGGGKINNWLYEQRYFFESVHFYEKGTAVILSHELDTEIVTTRNKIAALQRLNKFKELVIAPELIWGLATLIIIFLAIIAVFSANRFSQGISEPIQKLAQGMHVIADGDLSQPVDVTASDEIKFLVDTFNKMRIDLGQNRERLLRAEREAAWRDIARRVSHEIKNPLTPIQISLFRLRKKMNFEGEEGGKVENALDTIDEEMTSLRLLADEFSQFARMPELVRQPCQLNEIIGSAVILFESENSDVKLETDLSDLIPELNLDREQIKRVLTNLLKNATEAMAQAGQIKITTEPIFHEVQHLVWRISDSGPGMTDEIIQTIFEPYFSTKNGGRGLGLPIVKRIIEDHDGKIFAYSEPGHGTTFEIWL
ncbi:HAMP domain-containing protein [bacterium]|nr:HAMP domain-containing protein [bacterium]